MLVNSIQRFKSHKRTSIYLICIISGALLLSIFDSIQYFAKDAGNAPLATVFAVLGYILRPACMFLFIMLSSPNMTKRWTIILAIPLAINVIIFLFAFFPATKDQIFSFTETADGSLSFKGGPLRFATHIISLLYLIYLLVISISRLKKKHFANSIIILACAVMIILAVVIETFFNENGDVFILNPSIAVSAMFYYMYLFIERTKYDGLTGLFNREAFYIDAEKMEKSISGVIQFDMNGLKYFNDNFGHFEGDKGLATIASILARCSDRNMYAYRLGGDEFIILADGVSETEISKVIAKIRYETGKTKYTCSIGYAYRSKENNTIEALMKVAERNMYLDKEEFYKNSNVERRRAVI